MLIFVPVILVGVVTALVITGLTAQRPHRVWGLIICGSIMTAGISLNGFTLVDEFITFCVLLGVFMYVSVGFKLPHPRTMDSIERLHHIFFLILILYLIYQCFRGILELDSIRKLRWVAFFIMMGSLSSILIRSHSTIPAPQRFFNHIILSTLVYLIVYVGYGLIFESFFGVTRWDLQQYHWGTTAYSLYPVCITLPAVIWGLRNKDQRIRYLGWITLSAIIVAALYYDSRVVLLSVIVIFVLALPQLGVRRFAGAALVCAVVLIGFASYFSQDGRDLEYIANDLFSSGGSIWQEPEAGTGGRDIDRWIHLQVGYSAVTENWSVLLFGYGYRAHGLAISRYLYELYKKHLPNSAMYVRDDASTEGFTALVVDTGIIGLLLLSINFLLVGLQVIREKSNKYRYALLGSVVLSFIWLVIINVLDITLFYLAIMPSGLILIMAKQMTVTDKVSVLSESEINLAGKIN